jgi:hypothetical protein
MDVRLQNVGGWRKLKKYFNTDLAQREFDAERARYHWGKTGIGDKPIVVSTMSQQTLLVY